MKIYNSFFSRIVKKGTLLMLLLSIISLSSSLANQPNFKKKSKSIRVLMVGGGSSHDFDKWYKTADLETLERDGLAKVTYTNDPKSILTTLPEIDVLILCNNQPIADEATRKAIFDFVEAGKGLILCHAALWYNWADWSAYNQNLVSGGTRNHDRYGAFDVKVVNPKHPITKKTQAQFTLKDELYHFQIDPNGVGIEVLATGNVAGSDKVYPLLFVVKHPKAKIVGFTLGHDAESHNYLPYQTLLRNTLKWVAKK